jgi:hypothetical protein
MDTKKLDKEKIEQFVSMGMPKLLAAAYAKAIGSVCIMKLVDINEKNGKLKYAPIEEREIAEALMYLQEKGNDVMMATTPKSFNVESGAEPKYIVFIQNEPDTRSIELLLAHSIGRPTESIKVEQETKVLHVIAEEAMKRKDTTNLNAPITSPFSPWKTPKI